VLHPLFFTGNGFSIPNWEFGGNSVVTDEAVRLTPDRQNKRGNLWNKVPCKMENWELTVEFSVTGQGQSLFGDGFGVWFTEEHGATGPALGNTDTFKGLGIFVDTYDNHAEDHGKSCSVEGGRRRRRREGSLLSKRGERRGTL
jgi:mannose-binding lectin 2